MGLYGLVRLPAKLAEGRDALVRDAVPKVMPRLKAPEVGNAVDKGGPLYLGAFKNGLFNFGNDPYPGLSPEGCA